MFDKFKQKAETLNAEVLYFKSKTEALNFIKKFIDQSIQNSTSKEVIWCDSPFIEGVDKDSLLRELPQIEFNIDINSAAIARIGINQVDYGIADTGSIVEISNNLAKRLCSSLPEIHLAILPVSKIEPNMESVIKKLNMQEISYMTIISGPSRTADIERVLTIGVHGPERLVVICVDNF